MREQGSGSRHVVENALEKAGLKSKSFKRVMDLDSTESIKSAVEAGLGVGFVSRWAISKELELGALKVAQGQRPRISAPVLAHLAHGPGTPRPRPQLSALSLSDAPGFSQEAAKSRSDRADSGDKRN